LDGLIKTNASGDLLFLMN